MRKLLCLFFLLVFSEQLHAQFVDSIKYAIKQKAIIDGSIDTRNSFIANQRAQMTGYKIGVQFGETFKIGGGFNYISDLYFDAKRNKFYDNYKLDMAQLKLRYWAYYVEYQFYNTKHWEFSIPVQIGFGRAYYQYNVSKVKTPKTFAFIYEPSMNGTYKVFDWFGVGMNVGYRIMQKDKNKVSQNFNSPIYVITSGIYFGVLYRKFKKEIDKIVK